MRFKVAEQEDLAEGVSAFHDEIKARAEVEAPSEKAWAPSVDRRRG